MAIDEKYLAPKPRMAKGMTIEEIKKAHEELKAKMKTTTEGFSSQISPRAIPRTLGEKEGLLVAVDEHARFKERQKEKLLQLVDKRKPQQKLTASYNDDDVNVWNRKKRLSADSLEFSVATASDSSSSDEHDVPCGDPFCERCDIQSEILSDFLSDAADESYQTFPPAFYEAKPSRYSISKKLHSAKQQSVSERQRKVQTTEPIKTAQGQADPRKYTEKTWAEQEKQKLSERRKSPAWLNSEHKFNQKQFATQTETTNGTCEPDKYSGATLADSRHCIVPNAAQAAQNHLDDLRIQSVPNTGATDTISAANAVKRGRSTQVISTEDKTDLSPVKDYNSNRPGLPVNPKLITPKSPELGFDLSDNPVEVERKFSELSFRERERAAQLRKSTQEPVSLPRIGRGSRPPLSPSSGLAMCQSYRARVPGEYFKWTSPSEEEITHVQERKVDLLKEKAQVQQSENAPSSRPN
ncbi:hypothetical protein JX265_000362 [Neoarthrinium moseri]|uniref:Uncharacterized protein n=1 Tax=Neoarthrinium moseri TaxID=1658444 RepID=A0A9Q0AVH6_9PEZI|nr:hypothetical protein JX265_000362 [Neoarthrinium moseri]